MTAQHLLIPLDGSELAEAVLPLARALTTGSGAEVTLLRVVPSAMAAAHERRTATEALRAAAGPLRTAGMAVHIAVRAGEPVKEIGRVADECQVDLIVMATHSRAGLNRAMLGSIADGVLRKSRRPVVLLHPDHHQIDLLRTILIPVDGSPGAALAVGTAVLLARRHAAKLVLIRASVPLPLVIHEPTLGLDTGLLIDPAWDEDDRYAAEVYTERLAKRLRRIGVEAEGRGVSGLPAAAIIATAAEVDADLIVMSTHARTGPVRTILGSVADQVVRRSRRPVLLVRRGAHLRASRPTRQSRAPAKAAALNSDPTHSTR